MKFNVVVPDEPQIVALFTLPFAGVPEQGAAVTVNDAAPELVLEPQLLVTTHLYPYPLHVVGTFANVSVFAVAVEVVVNPE